jgi:ribosomal protein S18
MPLIAKFLNDTGKLYDGYQTQLKSKPLKKVAKTIKKCKTNS